MNKQNALWRKVLWSDKTKIKLFSHSDKRYFWMSKREAFTPKNSVPAVKHGGGSITLWAVLLLVVKVHHTKWRE